MRTVFMGTPDFALEALKALHQHHEIVCVYTQPPRPCGRGHKLTPSCVQVYAEQNNLLVRTPINFRAPEEKEAFKALEADVAIVAAYGLLLPQACLEAFKHGCINIHGSLLPRWRGAAPIQRAIMAGDKETGVTLMQMDKGMDTGAMLLKKSIPITKTSTSGSIFEQMSKAGAEVLIEGLALLEQGKLTPTPQPLEGVTHAEKIKNEERLIHFDSPSEEIDCKIRGLLPFPGAFFIHKGERISILEATPIALDDTIPSGTVCEGLVITCKTGGLKLNVLKREGKKALDAETFLRGYALEIGTKL